MLSIFLNFSPKNKLGMLIKKCKYLDFMSVDVIIQHFVWIFKILLSSSYSQGFQ